MRNTILVAVTAFVVGGVVTGALVADAQPPAPPPGPAMTDPGMAGPGPGGPMGGPPMPPPWMHRWARHMEGPGGERPAFGTFALVYRQADRQLSPADVQKIAEAFLLWHGNHSWKIVDVAPTADGPIGFAVATDEGSVIARFTMDPHTGRVTRRG